MIRTSSLARLTGGRGNILVKICLVVLGALPFSAEAVERDEVMRSLDQASLAVSSVSVRLTRSVKNIGPGNRALQEFNDEERISFDRTEQRVCRTTSRGHQLFDGKKRVLIRRVGSQDVESPMDAPVLQCLPLPLAYCLYPREIIQQCDVTSQEGHGRFVTLIGRHRDVAPSVAGQMRREFDVDTQTGMIQAARQYDSTGVLVSEIRMIGEQRHSGVRLPRQIRVRQNGSRNILLTTFSLDEVEVNATALAGAQP